MKDTFGAESYQTGHTAPCNDGGLQEAVSAGYKNDIDAYEDGGIEIMSVSLDYLFTGWAGVCGGLTNLPYVCGDSESQAAVGVLMESLQSGRPSAATVYRAVPKGFGYTIHDGDWVTLSRTYAENHGARNFGEDNYEILTLTVPMGMIWWDGESLDEFGYDSRLVRK